jgi:hypothetical protein
MALGVLAYDELLCHSLTSLLIEAHVQGSQNGRRLIWATIKQVVPVERRRQTVRYSLSVICNLWKAREHCTVFGTRIFSGGKKTVQAVLHEWYCNTTQERFYEAIRKPPKEMAEMFNLGGQNVEPTVVEYQPKCNNISATELIPNHFGTHIVKYTKIYPKISLYRKFVLFNISANVL